MTVFFSTMAAASVYLAASPAEGSSILKGFGITAIVALVPFIAIAGTSFIKIALVLSILRSALGSSGVIPASVITALSVVLSLFVMMPVVSKMSDAAQSVSMVPAGADPLGLSNARRFYDTVTPPLAEFLNANTPASEIKYFAGLAGTEGNQEQSLRVLLPAFAASEVVEAFIIGFLIFLPFLVIDLIVANTLLVLGLNLLSPTAVSLPLKLLLFTAVDGWHVLLDGLMLSYSF